MIRQTGKIITPSKNGSLRIEKNKAIPAPWYGLLKDVASTYKSVFEDNLLSVYIRGSVADGTAILGVSDFDSLAVCKASVNKDQFQLLEQFELTLSQKFPFTTSVEFCAYELNQVLTCPEYAPVRFQIKSLSRCVYGDDISEKIEEFTIKTVPDLCRHSVIDSYNYAKKIIESNHSTLDTIMICRWIMKQLVRAAFECNMRTGDFYTRDLYHCAKSACQHFPNLKDELWRSVELAVAPTSNEKEVLLLAQKIINSIQAV